ncbi:hypothetical protein HK102_008116 [Quaeritorhiza haematococci]|nr:hypothetical protein HK102_008116 [Quaeritorhiza haematococci]
MTSNELSLKVMRLSRPSLAIGHPIPHEPLPLQTTGAFNAAALNDLTQVAHPIAFTEPEGTSFALKDFGLSELLTLPSSFGNIYLGETFSSYLCVNNESSSSVQNVGIKVELQTSSQRFTLADTVTGGSPTGSIPGSPSTRPAPAATSSRVSLLPTQSAEYIVYHEIKELGIHILVCSVHFSVGNEKKFFRKFYKFQVLNPLAVKTKVNTLQDGRVFLEAQVQNIASSPMFLQRMKFEASELFNYLELNDSKSSSKVLPKAGVPISSEAGPDGGSESISVFGDFEYLNTTDTRQYLYMLIPKTLHDPLARSTPTLGKLDIVWRTMMGQIGRLQTSQLSRKVPPLDPFDMSVVGFPETVYAEEPFALTCRVRNNGTDKSVKIAITGVKSRMSSVLLHGPAEKLIGEVGPFEHRDFTLHFFPLLAGLHKITGLKVLEVNSGVTKELDNLADVYVMAHT